MHFQQTCLSPIMTECEEKQLEETYAATVSLSPAGLPKEQGACEGG